MTRKIQQRKIDALSSELPELIKEFKNWWHDHGGGPSLHFYQKTISRVRSENLKDLLKDESFIELLYATLTAWDMDARAANLKDFENFRENIGESSGRMLDLSGCALARLNKEELNEVKHALKDIYDGLSLMKSKAKLVCNSKFLHFTLPDLVMPMDRQNTVKYFYGTTSVSRKRFLKIFDASWQVAQKANLAPHLDEDFNLSGPKVIDNAINAKMRD